MSFRTVVISKANKISYKNRLLVVKNDMDETYIHLSEIDTLIVDSISVSISTYLLKELAINKINIIFCDEKHNPFGELSTYGIAYNSSKKIASQTKWPKRKKEKLWQLIVKNKILNQMLLLKKINSENADVLMKYIDEVVENDKTNREAHASKVYFNSLFTKKFIRNSDDEINAKLNYGYAILLSTINKEIVSNGYLTQLGINHKSEYNKFNLTCDLMEPFRVVIDNFVYYTQDKPFNTDYKMDLVNLFNSKFQYKNKKYSLKDIISFYVKNTLQYFEDNTEYKEFVFYEG